MSQSRLNKIVNETIQNVPVETLVSLCLVLRLNEDEAVDYLARCDQKPQKIKKPDTGR